MVILRNIEVTCFISTRWCTRL